MYVLCCSVNESVCLVCCVFDGVCELFGETIHNMFRCDCYFVVECDGVFSMVGGALLDRPCMVFQRVCVCVVPVIPVCFYMLLPYVCLCFCMSEVISSFISLIAGSQGFALLMLFICLVLHTMWSGKSLQLLYVLVFGMLCLFAISMMFVKIMLAVGMLVGMVV